MGTSKQIYKGTESSGLEELYKGLGKVIPEYVERAMRDVGISEMPGAQQDKRIVKMHSYTTLKAEDDETPWCASAMCAWLEESGIKSTRSAAASSYLDYGFPVDQPFLGCIIVTKRGVSESGKTLYHVNLYLGENQTHFWGLGGNQKNSVSYGLFDKDSIVSIRVPQVGG